MKFGLLWHSFSSGNLGVGALSLSNMMLIEEAAKKQGVEAEFVLIGSSGDCNYPPVGESLKYEFIEFSEKEFLKNPYKIYKAIKSCDAVFDIGEGDSFSDIYGKKRLIKLLVSKFMVLSAGVPLLLSPQTIGPFDTVWGRYIAAFIMKRCKEVFSRDHQSTKLLEKLNVLSRCEAVDVAFYLPYGVSHDFKRNSSKKIGLSISALLFHGGYRNNKNQFGLKTDYKKLTFHLVEELLDRGYEVHLIPHVIPKGFIEEDDYSLAEVLKERYSQLVLAPRFRGPVEAKRYMAGLDFLIGARMHATIGAFSAGVPVVPLAYSRKFSGLYESLDYGRVVNLKTESTESALQEVMMCLADYEQLKNDVVTSRAIISEKLAVYSANLEAFVSSLVNERSSGGK
ncbi:polysaccharide pyruvyl transferase family protein [Marinobacterium sp. YM272]|uniref:polysaccharide pyruvyl transferase family protein n=1 Tax=Marinobacterium sp. YM272 TaxID=3421654 RepID=UPI003D7FCCD5